MLYAASVNLKAFSGDVYHKLNGVRLQPVLNISKTLHNEKIPFEMINLVIPGYALPFPIICKRAAL